MFILFLIILCGTGAEASVPQTHRYLDQELKLDLFTGITGWDFFSGDSGDSQSKIAFVARAPKSSDAVGSPNATLTLRIDHSDARTSRIYAEKWLKEFPKFGYELQMSKATSYGALEGFEIELKSNTSERRIKQFLVKRPNVMWVFTCSSDQNHFGSVFKDCEKILKSAKIIL
jgi:hypothetical protein